MVCLNLQPRAKARFIFLFIRQGINALSNEVNKEWALAQIFQIACGK